MHDLMTVIISLGIIFLYIAFIRFTHGFLCRLWGLESELARTGPDAIFPSIFWPITLVCFLIHSLGKYIPIHQLGDRFAQYLMTPRKVRVEKHIQRSADDHMLHAEAMREVEETLNQDKFNANGS